MHSGDAGFEQLRLAELLATLSLATDLGTGQPMEQALRTCLVALELGERVGLKPELLSDVYYVALLRFLGCTADAYEFAQLVGGDDIVLRAAIAPVLGGTSSEFAAAVMPKPPDIPKLLRLCDDLTRQGASQAAEPPRPA